MPITRSAKKALRTSLRKKQFNMRRKERVTKATKSLKSLISGGKKDDARKKMSEFQKALDKAVKGGTLSKNTASRKKSRFSKMIKKIA
jgi:small subunit ribosomal protein S20